MRHAVDDEHIVSALDDVWRTPKRIKDKFRIRGSSDDVAIALTRLAADGRLERKVEPTKGIRARGARVRVQMLETFRRLQPAPVAEEA